MRPGDVHQLRVFAGDGALGNTTGVVGVGAGEPREALARQAALLGYPDTAFVDTAFVAAGLRVDSFSPFEELRFCTQTLLATEVVLRAEGTLAPGEPLTARTLAGTVQVQRYPDGVAYVGLPEEIATARAPRAGLPVPGPAQLAGPLVIDTGRARAYCLLPEEEIESVAVSPDAVRAYCAAEGVSGLCLTARRPDGSARLRVFTMSLDGAEDSGTGGAAGGVLAYWRRLGVPAPPVLAVHQGSGGPQARGELLVRTLDGGGTAVGGRVVPVASGRLSHPLTPHVPGPSS